MSFARINRSHFLIAAFFVLLALAATWPLAAHLGTQLPLGTETTATVPLLNTWTLEWNLNRLAHGYAGYWDAPIFYPATGAFAFSDPQPLTGLLAGLFAWGPPVLTYNLSLLSILALNGLAAYVLLRRLQRSRFAALAGGALVLLLPFFSHERGVLHLQPIFGPLLALYAVVLLLEHPSPRRGLLLGFFVAVTLLTSEQFGLILAVGLIPFGLYILVTRPGAWRVLLVAAVFVAILAGPLLLSQIRILDQFDFQRSEASVQAGSADLNDYFRPSSSTWLARWVRAEHTNFGLYPGLAIALLALLAVRANRARPFVWLLLISMALAWLLSLGLNLHIADWQPYRWIWERLPGFQHLRSPFRFGVWVQVGLALLAAYSLDALWRRPRRWPALLILILAAAEIFPLPTNLAAAPAEVDLSGIEGPAIFLPYVQGSSASAYLQTAVWMLQAQPAGLEIVNGYSGYFPERHYDLKDELVGFPDAQSLGVLRALGAHTILVPADWWQAAQPVDDDFDSAWLVQIEEVGDYIAFELAGQ